MKSFLEHLNEEVLPTVQVADGGLDISKPAVRAAINAAIAGVVSQPAVTPYVVFNRLSKLLAQYHIVLPKRFLEGDKGVEVFEVKQFGHKMGMTDSGEFVNEVPATHYLFLQYGILSPFGITYAKPVVGGMFKVMARLVDKEELDKLMDMAEITMAEEAEQMQAIAKANAPKEGMHTALGDCDCSQGDSPSTKKAVKVSMKKIDEDKDPCWKGYEMIGMKKKGGKPVPNCVPVKEEEQIDEISNKLRQSYIDKAGADVDAKRKVGFKKGFEEKKGKKAAAAREGMRKRIHGMSTALKGMDWKKVNEEQIDEVSVGKLIRYKKEREGDVRATNISASHSEDMAKHPGVSSDKRKEFGDEGKWLRGKQEKMKAGIKLADAKLKGKAKVGASMPKHPYMEETQIDEVSKRAAISAYREKEAQERDTGKLHGLIKKKFGAATAKHAERAGAADTGNLVHRGKSHGVDRLASAKSSSEMRKSKDGKIHKQDVASKKSEIKFRKSMSKFDKSRGHLPEETISEKAPPGAKFERMVKHIKKGYAEKDGLSKKEKSIAYATAWKAKNREKGE